MVQQFYIVVDKALLQRAHFAKLTASGKQSTKRDPMLTQIKRWYYPRTIEEAVAIIQQGRGKPYGGGTTILRGEKSNLRALLSLRQLSLDGIATGPQGTVIGAQVTFSRLARQNWSDGRRILCAAVGQAASPSLRNLITVGGSLAARPSWSNLPAALLVLNAQAEVAGEEAGSYAVETVLQEGLLKGRSLVLRIVLPPAAGEGCYWRYARTAFDYAVAEMAAYWEVEAQRIKTFRLALANLLPVARRLPNLEARFIGQKLTDITPVDIGTIENLKMTRNPNFSTEFRLNLINQWLVELVRRMREGVCR